MHVHTQPLWWPFPGLWVKDKEDLDSCHSAACVYQVTTHDQQWSTTLKVVVDWHELMVPQRIMQPSTVHVTGQFD